MRIHASQFAGGLPERPFGTCLIPAVTGGSRKAPPAGCLRPHDRDAEADVVGTPLRLVAQAAGRPAGPAVVTPGPAPAGARKSAVPVSRPLHRRQVRVHTAGQLLVVPVPAPLEGVAVHVVQA